MSARRAQPRAWAAFACAAAVAATMGDFALLYVVNARRPELGLAPAPGSTLAVGGWLGALAIPLYGLGYRSAAALVPRSRARAVAVVTWGGVLAGLIGGAIHALTTRAIAFDIAGDAPPLEPLAALAGSPLIVGLWAVVTVLALVVSAAFALGVKTRRGIGTIGWMNPAFLTVVIAAIGVVALSPEISRSFFVPAAPNLAHVCFFAACALSRPALDERRP